MLRKSWKVLYRFHSEFISCYGTLKSPCSTANSTVRIAGVIADIRSEDLPNTNPQLSPLHQSLGLISDLLGVFSLLPCSKVFFGFIFVNF